MKKSYSFHISACAFFGFVSLAGAADQLAPPVLTASSGFNVQLLVPPGKVFDPLYFTKVGDRVWFNDDGGADEKKENGGYIWAVDDSGKVTVIADPTKFKPITGWGIAPPGFGKNAGKIYALSIPAPTKEGAYRPNLIQIIDQKHNFKATKVCDLPPAGSVNNMLKTASPGSPGIGSLGADGRFGPDGSGFEKKFFATTLNNATIYQTTPDGACAPFLVLDGKHFSRPNQLDFTADHKAMLVVVAVDAGTPSEHGGIIRVAPDGKIDDHTIDLSANFSPFGISVAPNGFGEYGGQAFVAGADSTTKTPEAPRGQSVVIRVAADGSLHPVARGWFFIYDIDFVDSQRLFIADIHGDYVVGGVEAPDGTVSVIRVAK